jgi:hypothetical protein
LDQLQTAALRVSDIEATKDVINEKGAKAGEVQTTADIRSTDTEAIQTKCAMNEKEAKAEEIQTTAALRVSDIAATKDIRATDIEAIQTKCATNENETKSEETQTMGMENGKGAKDRKVEVTETNKHEVKADDIQVSATLEKSEKATSEDNTENEVTAKMVSQGSENETVSEGSKMESTPVEKEAKNEDTKMVTEAEGKDAKIDDSKIPSDAEGKNEDENDSQSEKKDKDTVKHDIDKSKVRKRRSRFVDIGKKSAFFKSRTLNELRPFYNGSTLDHRMMEIRKSIYYIRENWEDFDKFLASLKQLLLKDGNLTFEEPEDQAYADKLLTSKRTWLKKFEVAFLDVTYDAIKLYTSSEGYGRMYRLSNEIFRREDSIDVLFNYCLKKPAMKHCEGMAYRGMCLDDEDITAFKSLRQEPMHRRNIAVPLGKSSTMRYTMSATIPQVGLDVYYQE